MHELRRLGENLASRSTSRPACLCVARQQQTNQVSAMLHIVKQSGETSNTYGS